MPERVQKLGILISGPPEASPFLQGVQFADAALAQGIDVYLYCLDQAVQGVRRSELQALRSRGLKLYACAYGAQQHGVPLDDSAAFAGLTVVNDLMVSTDRFISFN